MPFAGVLLAVLSGLGLAVACSPEGKLASGSGPCDGDISWEFAADHVGEVETWSGTVESVRFASDEAGSPTFVNIGADYPDPERLTLVFWETDANDYESLRDYDSKTVCVQGQVELYRGVPQIVADSSAAIWEVESSWVDKANREALEERLAREAAERAERLDAQCSPELFVLLNVLTEVDTRLDVGMNQSQLSDLVGDARVVYDRIDVRELERGSSVCLRAGVQLESALNAYSRSTSQWEKEPSLQRLWRKARNSIGKAEPLMDGLDP